MKKKNALGQLLSIFSIIVAFSFASCSNFGANRKTISESENKNDAFVSKSKYDELEKKYNELLKSMNPTHETQEDKKIEISNISPDGLNNLQSTDPSELLNTIEIQKSNIENKNEFSDNIEESIAKIREVYTFIESKNWQNALAILKMLEKSKEKQILARVSYLKGELFYRQGEFDLASQSFEEQLKKYSFSGFTLLSINKLIKCYENLKQIEKQKEYILILNEFLKVG